MSNRVTHISRDLLLAPSLSLAHAKVRAHRLDLAPTNGIGRALVRELELNKKYLARDDA